MANILIYDKDGQVTDYRESVNTPDFPEALIVATRPTTPLKYLKVIDGVLTEIPQIEKDAITTLEAQKIADAEATRIAPIDAIKDIEGVKDYLKTCSTGL